MDNEIKPIFIKGSSFLVQEIYSDVAERMIGDIDILINSEESDRSIKILKKNGYDFLETKIVYQISDIIPD